MSRSEDDSLGYEEIIKLLQEIRNSQNESNQLLNRINSWMNLIIDEEIIRPSTDIRRQLYKETRTRSDLTIKDFLVEGSVIKRYIGCNEEVVIPSNCGLNIIGENAFLNCSQVARVVIPDTIIEIGNYAFKNCTNLKSVQFQGTLSTVGLMIFDNCVNLRTVEGTSNLIGLGYNPFSKCLKITDPVYMEGGRKLAYVPKHVVEFDVPAGVTQMDWLH